MNLESLKQTYPLPNDWEMSEPFTEYLKIGSLDIYLVGLCASSPRFGEVSASAASSESFEWVRAYFELLERVSIKEAASLLHLDAPSSKWVFSKSNGIAAHVDRPRAVQAAARELVERDRILRSWYGETVPRRIQSGDLQSDSILKIQKQLEDYYRFEAYDFGHCVAGVCGFPIDAQHPLIYGFGAAPNLTAAVSHSLQEVLQTLGFLWGENLPEEMPEFTPSPDFHLEYCSTALGKKGIQDWLAGKNFGRFKLLNAYLNANEVGADLFQYTDLTPASLASKICVVKASSLDRLPLTFGMGNPGLQNMDSELDAFLIHPIA